MAINATYTNGIGPTLNFLCSQVSKIRNLSFGSSANQILDGYDTLKSEVVIASRNTGGEEFSFQTRDLQKAMDFKEYTDETGSTTFNFLILDGVGSTNVLVTANTCYLTGVNFSADWNDLGSCDVTGIAETMTFAETTATDFS